MVENKDDEKSPKYLLFKKGYLLENGEFGPLFKSQKELADSILDYSSYYKNSVSLLTLLSKAFRKSNRYPLPARLIEEIIEVATIRILQNHQDSIQFKNTFPTILSNWLESDDNSETDKSFRTYQKRIKQCNRLDYFSRKPLILFWEEDSRAKAFMEEMLKNLFDNKRLNNSDLQYHFYVNSREIAILLWEKIESFFALKKNIMSAIGYYNVLKNLNSDNKISIFVVRPELVIISYLYIQNDTQKDLFIYEYSKSNHFNILHLPSENTQNWIKYFYTPYMNNKEHNIYNEISYNHPDDKYPTLTKYALDLKAPALTIITTGNNAKTNPDLKDEFDSRLAQTNQTKNPRSLSHGYRRWLRKQEAQMKKRKTKSK
jgi:hypothetical protein